MSDRRRRRAKEDDSDAESNNSGNAGDSASDNGDGSEADEVSPPNYEEAVQLETETQELVTGATASTGRDRKPKSGAAEQRKDPAFVPRSDRFFLHDNREDERGRGAPRRGGRFSERGPPRDGGNKKAGELDWKHDKYEELIANEPEQTKSRTRQNRDGSQQQGTSTTNARSAQKPAIEPSRSQRNTPAKVAQAEPSSGNRGASTPQQNVRGPPSSQKSAAEYSAQRSGDSRVNSAAKATPSSNKNSNGREVRDTPTRGPPAQSTISTPHSGQKSSGDYRTKQSREVSQSHGGEQSKHVSRVVTVSSDAPTGRSVLPAGATAHATAPTKHSAGSARSTPMKPPPGLDAVALNPSAREFQPTEDGRGNTPSPPPQHSGSGRKGGKQWKYGDDPASYSYSTDPAKIPLVLGSVTPLPVMASGVPPVQQTVTFRASTMAPPTATTPGASISTTTPSASAAPSQQVTYKEHVQYPERAAAHVVQPTAADYLPGARHRTGPPPTDDMYAHMSMQQHGNMGMYRQGAVLPGGYGMPMNGMGMPVYDPQMMYMHDAPVMQMGHYGDGTMWYNVPQGMSMPGVQAEGAGGTVYYPLPPQPPTTE